MNLILKRTPVYGFVDESSSLNNEAKFFCVAILCTSHDQKVGLKRVLKKTRQKLLKSQLRKLPELKFSNSRENVRIFVLSELAKLKVVVGVLVVDKGSRQVLDTPENYGLVVGSLVERLMRFYGAIILNLDKRYTSPAQTERFMNVCQSFITHESVAGTVLFNPPVESKENQFVQLVDFVAGAFNYKYNRGDSQYVNLFRKLVKFEDMVRWQELKKR